MSACCGAGGPFDKPDRRPVVRHIDYDNGESIVAHVADFRAARKLLYLIDRELRIPRLLVLAPLRISRSILLV
jgi:hypothetical protein